MILELLTHGLGAHDLSLAILRACVGTFFAISGWHKLTNHDRHARLVATLVSDKVPFVRFNQWWVPLCEFVFGAMLVIGLFTALSALVLILTMCVAAACEASSKVRSYGPIDFADKVDDYLYLPEVLYIILLSVHVISGTGKYSLDQLLWR